MMKCQRALIFEICGAAAGLWQRLIVRLCHGDCCCCPPTNGHKYTTGTSTQKYKWEHCQAREHGLTMRSDNCTRAYKYPQGPCSCPHIQTTEIQFTCCRKSINVFLSPKSIDITGSSFLIQSPPPTWTLVLLTGSILWLTVVTNTLSRGECNKVWVQALKVISLSLWFSTDPLLSFMSPLII